MARTALILSFALILAILGITAVSALMSAAAGVFQIIPHT